MSPAGYFDPPPPGSPPGTLGEFRGRHKYALIQLMFSVLL